MHGAPGQPPPTRQERQLEQHGEPDHLAAGPFDQVEGGRRGPAGGQHVVHHQHALTGLEGMTKHDLTGKLEKVAGNEATLVVTGTAAGVWQGAQLKSSVEATATYDLAAKRLTKLVWKQKDDRDQGPVSPASSLQVTITLGRKAIDRPASLDDVALVSVPDGFTPPGQFAQVCAEARDGLQKLKAHILQNADSIRTTRAKNGLPNRGK